MKNFYKINYAVTHYAIVIGEPVVIPCVPDFEFFVHKDITDPSKWVVSEKLSGYFVSRGNKKETRKSVLAKAEEKIKSYTLSGKNFGTLVRNKGKVDSLPLVKRTKSKLTKSKGN